MEHINLGKFILHMFTFYVTINLKNLQNSYPRRKRTGYYGILPLRVQIFLNARNPRSKLRGIQRRINLIHFLLTHVTQKMSLADFGAALTLRPLPMGEGT